MRETRLVLFIAVFLAIVVVAIGQFKGSTGISNDGAHYLTGARYLRSHFSYSTDILYFDDHYSRGDVPVPQTVWSPGTSASIALLSLSGLSLESAGRLSASVFYVCMIALFAGVVRKFGLSAIDSLAAVIWLLSITFFWRYSTMANSDMPFTATTLAATWFLVRRLHSSHGPDGTRLLTFSTYGWISLLAGVSFLFRYAGIFVIAWSMALIGIEFLYRMARGARPLTPLLLRSIGAALPALAIFGAVALRNFLLTGGVKGYEKEAQNSVVYLLERTAELFVTILTGVSDWDMILQPSLLAPFAAAALAIVLAASLFLLIFVSKIAIKQDAWDARSYSLLQIVLLAAVYLVGFFALGVNTLVVFDARYLLPIVPLFVIASIASAPKVRLMIPACVAVICVTQFAFVDNSGTTTAVEQHSRYASLTRWLENNTEQSERLIAAGDGQLIGYFSNRPTFAIPATSYTDLTWDSESIRQLALEQHVSVVIAGRFDKPEQFTTPVVELMQGKPWPWLELIEVLESAYIYRVSSSQTP